MSSVPTKMRALFLVKNVTSFDQQDLASCFEVREVDVPVPKSGEVLVKMECSPINPSDLHTLTGTYAADENHPKELPTRIGYEGSGTVVGSGGGLLAWWVQGKRVGVVAEAGGMMWAEFVVVPALHCLVLPNDVSFEAGSSCFVNPLTVVAFVEIAQSRKSRAIVHTAAASTLGKMLIRYARENGITVVCVVRREEQANTLKELGAQHVVVSSQEGWTDDLARICRELNVTLGFEAVGGSLTGDVINAMPEGSELFSYGTLSEQACENISPGEMRFRSKKLSGFWLPVFLKEKGIVHTKSMLNKVAKGLSNTLATGVRVGYPLEEAATALKDYTTNMSNDKVVFRPAWKKSDHEDLAMSFSS